MRRKHLILASCIISALLLTFTFHVSADENVTADAGASSNSAPLLDSYFWDNYDLLPYIESDGQQYIDTGVYLDNNSVVRVKFIPLNSNVTNYPAIFGSGPASSSNKFYSQYTFNNGRIYFEYSSGTSVYTSSFSNYMIYDCEYSDSFYVNGHLVTTFDDVQSFTSDFTASIFSIHQASNSYGLYSSMKLYNFSIYDSLNEEYVRYYYPARSKSGNVIGLYDAVSKTFVTTGGSVPFASPTDDKVIHFQIGDFITSGLGWIGDILDFAIQEPMILMFMAIGLCGVAFRWARRVVHF